MAEKEPYITINLTFARTDYGNGEVYAESTGIDCVTANGLTSDELRHWADHGNCHVLLDIVQDYLPARLESLADRVDKDEKKD